MSDRLTRSLAGLVMAGLMLFGAHAAQAGPEVRLETSHGPIVVELFDEQAPRTVENFLGYVRDGFYEGTIFHRVIPGFMAQGGGFTADFQRKPTRAAVVNEADNGLANRRGTIAMARTSDPDSATSQFFINLVDNDFLNRRDASAAGAGYTVFGQVIDGMDTLDRIASIPTGPAGPLRQDVPRETVLIESATLLDPAED
ncbi:peptidylprolyl isomerase [Guyparkeria sp. 1SP6A2]|nr:peptidylprolyl isomerase [Guyparkeria sp. 1SP6A2]